MSKESCTIALSAAAAVIRKRHITYVEQIRRRMESGEICIVWPDRWKSNSRSEDPFASGGRSVEPTISLGGTFLSIQLVRLQSLPACLPACQTNGRFSSIRDQIFDACFNLKRNFCLVNAFFFLACLVGIYSFQMYCRCPLSASSAYERKRKRERERERERERKRDREREKERRERKKEREREKERERRVL
jgi:hypothetical protein